MSEKQNDTRWGHTEFWIRNEISQVVTQRKLAEDVKNYEIVSAYPHTRLR